MPLDCGYIRKRRQRLKLSPTAAAERAGMDRHRWWMIEAGRANPTVSTLDAIAKALRVSAKRLVR